MRIFHQLAVVVAAASLSAPAPAFAGGMNLLSARGLGAPNDNLVRVHDASGVPTGIEFYAYGAGQWGTNIAAGNITWGMEAVITGPGPGEVYGPHIRGFVEDNGSVSPLGGVNFYAYGTLRYGAITATLEFDRNEEDEMMTGAAPGVIFGPHVRGWDYDGRTTSPMAKVNFFAYFTLRWGVNPYGADVDGDGYDEILTGPGPGVVFGPQVRGWNADGQMVRPMGKINFNAYQVPQFGANIAAGDVDFDYYEEILTAPGPGPTFPSDVRGFDFDGTAVNDKAGCRVTPFASKYGGRVGGGFFGAAGTENDILTAPGRDPAAPASLKVYEYTGSSLNQTLSFQPFTSSYGANVTSTMLGL